MLASKEGLIDVLTAAKKRIINIFSNGVKVYMAFSCGKDSLVMSSLVYDLIVSGQIDKSLLTVYFIDEEGIYPDMEEAAYRWHDKFTAIGVPFWWFCLPFAQISVIDNLSASESWITWEPGKEDEWIRQPPKYAIMDSPYLEYPGQMAYQQFTKIALKDGLNMIGIRTAESLTRQRTMATSLLKSIKEGSLTAGGHVFPIYDWKDSDVWLYIKEKRLEFPEIYIRMYEAGTSKNNLRLCAFFGDNGVNGLLHLMETSPDLWERVERRMPNAYLAVMYWDTEMFSRNTKKRRSLEKNTEKDDEKDYRKLLVDLLIKHPEKYNIPTGTDIKPWKRMFLKLEGNMDNKDCKECFEKILYGDPKRRNLRMMHTKVQAKALKKAGLKGRGETFGKQS